MSVAEPPIMPPSAETALPAPPPEALAHSSELAERIAQRIAQEGDWVPFSKFMEMALYEPRLGYYAAGARKFGEGGDFVTAPEISDVFAKCLALQARQVLAKTGGDILELGPGSGVLAADMFEELLAHKVLPERYLLLEVSPDLRERQRKLLAFRFPQHIGRFVWLDSLPQKITGFVIANEVLDVVPCSMVHRTDGRLLERGVIVSEAGFAWDDQPMPDDALKRRAEAVFPPGDYSYLSEINLAAEGLVRTIAASIDKGVALFIDYGFPEREYYHPQRHMGTLMCHRGHVSDPDPLRDVGLKDITAHVNFSGVAYAAQEAGLPTLGYTTQARFLMNCGIVPMLAEASLAERIAGQRLIAEHEMGELFKVIGFYRGDFWDAVGFGEGDRTHTL